MGKSAKQRHLQLGSSRNKYPEPYTKSMARTAKKSTPSRGGVKKKPAALTSSRSPAATPNRSTSRATPARRRRPGMVALKEIRKYQKSTDLLIRKLPFARLVRDITLARAGRE